MEIAAVRQSQHSLIRALRSVITDDHAWRVLWPIALEWMKSPTQTYNAANATALRTQLIAEHVARLVTKHADRLPSLARHLAPAQFNTIALMAEFKRFDADRFEAAVGAAVNSKHVDQRSVVDSLASASFLRIAGTTRSRGAGVRRGMKRRCRTASKGRALRPRWWPRYAGRLASPSEYLVRANSKVTPRVDRDRGRRKCPRPRRSPPQRFDHRIQCKGACGCLERSSTVTLAQQHSRNCARCVCLCGGRHRRWAKREAQPTIDRLVS